MTSPRFEWDAWYQDGNTQRYPWDRVVSFVFRRAPKDRARSEVRILEVGCGAGSNLWFAAREGFSVCGIDGSATAIETARRRFAAEGLSGEFVTGDFTRTLPYPDARFDLAIDRGAIFCADYAGGRRAIDEIGRVLKPGGIFLFGPYSRRHSSYASGTLRGDGRVGDISRGTMMGVGDLCFYSEEMVREALSTGWTILSLSHHESRTATGGGSSPDAPDADVHAEWSVVARRTP